MGRQPNREPRNADEEICQLRQEIDALRHVVENNRELIHEHGERVERLNQVVARYLTTDQIVDMVTVMREEIVARHDLPVNDRSADPL